MNYNKQKNQQPALQIIGFSIRTQSRGRTGTGVTPLVFETSASTNSAIWAKTSALRAQKYNKSFILQIFFQKNQKNILFLCRTLL